MSVFTGAVLASSFAFLFYGFLCLASSSMKHEFVRFGIPGLRILTGLLELLGAIALLAGLYWPFFFLPMASGGLFLLMVGGVGVRLRIRDPLGACMPAVVLMLLNAFIFLHSLPEL